jgi:acyl-CoA hydrolase
VEWYLTGWMKFLLSLQLCTEEKKFVTVSTDKIDFKTPIPEGSIVELFGEVIEVGKANLVVRVDIFAEEMYSRDKHLAVQGNFSLVAIDHDKNPIPIH